MGDFDYLMETLDEVSNQAPEQDSLAKLKALVELYKNQKDTVDSLEEQLSQAKAAFYKTSKELIPQPAHAERLVRDQTSFWREGAGQDGRVAYHYGHGGVC